MRVEPLLAGAHEPRRDSQSRRLRLKAATAAAHDRVETIVQGGGMFAGLEGYRRYLHATLEARATVEGELDAAGAECIFAAWPARRLCSAIASDISDLAGIDTPRPQVAQGIAVSPALTVSQQFGRLYVLEGSALGAKILMRSALEIGLSSTHGARHLHAQANEGGVWRDFCALLEAQAFSMADEAELFAAAAQTFDRFATAYSRARL